MSNDKNTIPSHEECLDIWDSLTPKQCEDLQAIEITQDGSDYGFEILEHMGLVYMWSNSPLRKQQKVTKRGKAVLEAYRKRRDKQWGI